jgi:integrase
MIKPYWYESKKYYEIQTSHTNKHGQRKQIKTRFDQYKQRIASEAKARKSEFEILRTLKDQDERPSQRVLSFQQWHELFLKEAKQTLKTGTVKQYDGDLKKWLPKDFIETNIRHIKRQDIQSLILDYLPLQGATVHTQKRITKNLSRIFEVAIDEELISHNPARSLKIKVPPAKKDALNSHEARMLLTAAKEVNHPFYHIWAFALLSGMRSGEMQGLRWSDIDLKAGNVHVCHQWTSKDGYHSTKSNKNRVVPISKELNLLLVELKNIGAFKDTLKGLNKTTHVFDDLVLPRPPEWKYGQQAIVLKDFLEAIEVKPVKFHDLRATFITNLLSQGVPLVTVMAIVGHSKMSTTDEYVRLAGINVRGATDRLGYNLPRENEHNLLQLV